MTPEPQYATSSPSGSSGSGSAHGAFSAPGMRPGRVVDRVRLAAPAVRRARVDEHERRIGEPPRDLLGVDRVAVALARHELGGLDLLVAARAAGRPTPSSPPSSTAQSSWPKCRSSHQSRSAPPSEP